MEHLPTRGAIKIDWVADFFGHHTPAEFPMETRFLYSAMV